MCGNHYNSVKKCGLIIRKMLCQSRVQCLIILFILCLSWRLAKTYSIPSTGGGGGRIERTLDDDDDTASLSLSKLKVSSHPTVKGDSLSSLQDLENKLDLILEGENREKELLQYFLLNNNNDWAASTTPVVTETRRSGLHGPLSKKKAEGAAVMVTAESQIMDKSTGEVAIITVPDAPSQAQEEKDEHHHPTSQVVTVVGSAHSREDSANDLDDNEEEKEEKGATTVAATAPDFNLKDLSSQDDKLQPRRQKKDNRRSGEEEEDEEENQEMKDSSIIVKKLEENSKRMETMVIFLADLRNVLSEAVASQEKQVALRGEVVELREEIDYLRKEVQKLRTEQVQNSALPDPKLQNKIHNDETTIEWLKESLKELRHGMEEVSSSVNVTGLVHLKQQWDTEVNRVDGDLRSLRNDVESLKVNQARDDEALLEIKGDIADLRTWHIKMGQKFLQEEQETQELITGSTEFGKDQRSQWENKVSETNMKKKSLTFLSNKPSTTMSPTKGGNGKSRHQRRLQLEVTKVESVIQDVVRDQALLHKRVVRLERKFVTAATQLDQRGEGHHHIENHDNNKPDGEEERVSSNEIRNNNNMIRGGGGGGGGRKRSIGEYSASNSYRINSLERTVADYANTLQHLNDKVVSLHELRESTTQLFTALEALETKYDERLTEMQTGLARLEATVSTTSITNDELKEQQNLQSRVMQTFKKDFMGVRDQVHTNHLRLAAVQSQLLKWGLKTCSDQNGESIQNIKIAALEAAIQAPS